MSRTCRHPGCGASLYYGNRSGVCRDHAHTDYCQCGQCLRKRGEAPKLRERGTRNQTCPVPGCTSRLGKSWENGVCRKHKCNPDYCQCALCEAKRAARPKVKDRPGLTQVRVPCIGSGSSVEAHAMVTMPVEPDWIGGEL